MAINFLNNVDYNQNQLLHPTIENQPNDAAAGTPVSGQLYYNTTPATKGLKVGEGGSWVYVGGGVESITTVDSNYVDLTDTGTAADPILTASLNAVDGVAAETAAGNGIRYLSKNNKWAEIDAIPGTYEWEIQGDTGGPTTVASGDIIDFAGGTNVTTALSGTTLTINATDNNDNDYLTALSFNIGDGVLTATVQNQSDVTVDLDGRYLELAGGTMDGEINMGSDKITNLLDPTNAQDAATKAYVDNLVDGGLTFKDGFNANTGAIDGSGNLYPGVTRVAISVGDYYVVTTAGDFYGDSSYPLTVGDSVIAKEDAVTGASVVTDWVIIQGDEGVVDLTSGNGGTSTGNALTSNTTARGSVTVNSFSYGGTTNVGHVPSGGSGTTFLRGDGTWVTPTNTTPNDATITLTAGTNLTGGGDFTTDQSTNETIAFNLATADDSTVGAGNVDAGTGISVAYAAGTATVTNTDTNSANTFSGLIGNGTLTSLPITSGTHGLGTDSTSFMIQLVEVSSGETVYADVVRGANGLVTIVFAVAPASNSIRVLIQKIG